MPGSPSHSRRYYDDGNHSRGSRDYHSSKTNNHRQQSYRRSVPRRDDRDGYARDSHRGHHQDAKSEASPPPATSTTNRRISTSRERSRERERRRRRLQTESVLTYAPMTPIVTVRCIKRAGGFQKLADSEGKEPVRLFWDGFQWVTRTGNSSTFQTDPSLINNTRKLRRLYFGNLPLHLGLTESLFQDLIWIEMKTRGICNDPNQHKGNYGFVEFASVEETNRALEALDGMLCMGVPLKVSRPNNDYSGFNFFPFTTNQFGAAQPSAVPGAALATGTTRVVRFCKIIQESDMEDHETWSDFLDDIKSGCSQHGTITGSVIITPDKKDECPYGVGDVFLEFSTPLEAAACITGMTGRRYLDRPVELMAIEDPVYNQLVKPLSVV